MSTSPGEELEELLAAEGLQPVGKLIQRHPATIWRWIQRGCRGVRLEATKDGGSWVTSAQAVARFRARCRGATLHTPIESASSLAKRATEAEQERQRIIKESRKRKG